jgi:hypothetical protein
MPKVWRAPLVTVLPLPTFAPAALDQTAQCRFEFAGSLKVGARDAAQSRGNASVEPGKLY